MANTQFNLLPTQPPRIPPRLSADHEWRCQKCAKLLGLHRAGRLHLAFQGHDYRVSLPAEATCRRCGTFNQVGLTRAL